MPRPPVRAVLHAVPLSTTASSDSQGPRAGCPRGGPGACRGRRRTWPAYRRGQAGPTGTEVAAETTSGRGGRGARGYGLSRIERRVSQGSLEPNECPPTVFLARRKSRIGGARRSGVSALLTPLACLAVAQGSWAPAPPIVPTASSGIPKRHPPPTPNPPLPSCSPVLGPPTHPAQRGGTRAARRAGDARQVSWRPRAHALPACAWP
eukprot:COSAG04_NODE_8334_length_988_cov_1.620922_1_plen_207_part_00